MSEPNEHEINYTPPPTVDAFIQHYLPGELFFSWILGPYGSSKTTGIFFKLARMAALQAPSRVDGIRRTRAVVVRNTYPQLRDTTLVSWGYWFKDGVAGKWSATNKSFMLKFADVECEVLFRALDTPDDIRQVKSLEVTFAVLDEFTEIAPEIRDALSARCGRYPPKNDMPATNWGMWGASNTGNEDSDWHGYLYAGTQDNMKLFTQPSGFSPDAENVENLPGGRAYYTNLAKGKSANWIKQFIEVEWGHSLSGTPVVATFNGSFHTARTAIEYDPALPLIIGFDPGMSSALIFGQFAEHNRLRVLHESVNFGVGATRLIKDILSPTIRARFPGAKVIISPDPAAFNRSQTDERSVVDVFRAAGFDVRVPDMNNRTAVRLEAIEQYTARLTPDGPALEIDPRCKMLIRALSGGWCYNTSRTDVTSSEPIKNKHSHPGDAFGYLCRYGSKGVVNDDRDKRVAAAIAASSVNVSYNCR